MIQDILPRYQEVANGSKTAFTFPFDVLRNEFIEVYVGSDKVTSGWTLSASEKTITFGVAPVAGKVITIYRNIPVEWINNLGTASSASIGEAITYLVAQIQTIKEGLSRAIQTRITDTDKGEDLSDDYINSLGQATSLYGQCEILLAQIQSEGADIEALYLEFLGRMNNFISTDTNLGTSDTVVPSQKAVKTYVDNKDSQNVHKTGTETITGNKTFTSNVVRANTNITKGTNPSSKTWCTVAFTDKNGEGTKNRVGLLESAINTNGDIETLMGAYKYENDSTNMEKISITYSKTGNIYTYAPPPTDTTTTSGTQIATTGWVNSTDNNAVHKTGDETIAGKKTFSGNIKLAAQSGSPQSGLFISSDYTTYAVSVQDTKITKGTAPSSNSYCGIDFYGTATTNYANRLGLLEFRYDTEKLTSASLCAFKSNTASDSASARVAVHYPASGNPYTEAPASDANNSIVTTVGKNKAQNGYFKLGNGLIIQWGRFTVASGKTSATITFPTAFTSTNYSINCMQNSKNGGYQYDGVTGVTSRNTANCTVYTFYDSTGYDWIAIGY